MKSDYYLVLSMEINSKIFKDLNERANTIKLLEENTGINLQDPGLQNGFLDSTRRKKIDKLDIQLVQLLSCVQLFMTPWTAAHQASLSITNSQSLLKLMSIELVMPSNHLILCCPLPPAFSLSHHQGLF